MKKQDLYTRILAANPSLRDKDISTSKTSMPKIDNPAEKGGKVRATRLSGRQNRRSFENEKSTVPSSAVRGRGRNGSVVVQTSSIRNERRSARQSFTPENNPLKAKEKSSAPPKVFQSPIVENPTITRISTPAQKEGVDFILLHEGPKLFWRLHTTIDIMIYYHREDDCLEIIGFDQVIFTAVYSWKNFLFLKILPIYIFRFHHSGSV